MSRDNEYRPNRRSGDWPAAGDEHRPYQQRVNRQNGHGYYADATRRQMDPRMQQRSVMEHNAARRSSYSRRNMIYAPHKRRKWPFVLIAIVIIVVVVLVVSNCHGSGQQQEQSAQQDQTTQQTDSGQQAQSGDTGQQAQQQTGGSELSPLRSEDERKATSTSNNTTKPGRKVVYLTFDDGPSTETHKILDILNHYGVHATWFVIGNRGHLEYVKDIWAAGNQVGLHSETHEYDADYKTASAYYQGLDTLGAKVKNYLGFTPTIFRFPGGSVNDFNRSVRSGLKEEAAERHWHYFDWNVSSGDATGNGVAVSKLIKNIKKESAGVNSACVLMHDTEAKATTVDALPQIIEYYRDQGFTFDVLTADSYGYHF